MSPAGGGRRVTALPVGLVAFVVILAALAWASVGGAPGSPPSPAPTGTAAAAGSSTPLASPPASPPPAASPSGSAGPSPGPSPTPPAGSAPTSATGFSLFKTVVHIAFPLSPRVRYRYVDNFLEPRSGPVKWYNHVRGKTSAGTLVRAHDGVDLRAAVGTPLLAVFSGTVVDAATIWKPWTPARYGLTVVIQSDEPTSIGYRALYAHLARVGVAIGQHVARGDVVGRLGVTGNAQADMPHLHFELRTPFLIPVREGGQVRRLDAFDPFPSLLRADPRR